MIDFNNLILLVVALVVAVVAIYALWSIVLFQGINKKGDELQLSTKKILEQVKILYDKKEYALVQLLATKYLDRVPRHLDVRVFLAKAYLEDKKYNQAIRQCKIITKKRPYDIETHKVLGMCYVKKQIFDKAILEYEFLYEHNKGNSEFVRTLAELYRETDQLFSSVNAYQILSDLTKSEDEIAKIQAIIAELDETMHDYPAAFEAYKRILGIYPEDVETNKKLTELYIKIKNNTAAIETLLFMETFVGEPKTLLWLYDSLVNLYVEANEYEKAIEYSKKLLNIPGSDRYRVESNIATYHLELRQFTEGISILEDLTMLSQNEFNITIQLADAYIKIKDYNKALERYNILMDKATQQEAKTLNLLICDLYISWAIDMAEGEHFEESYEYLKSAAQYNTLNSEIYFNVALNNMKQKNFSAAVEVIQKAIEYDKQNVKTSKYLLLLSEAHHHLGNFFEEKKALTDLLKIDDKNPEGLYRLGLMHVAQHDVKNAEEAFKKVIKLNPDLIQAKFNLALLYENNNRDRAKELYIEVLEQDPSFEEAKIALADLTSNDMF